LHTACQFQCHWSLAVVTNAAKSSGTRDLRESLEDSRRSKFSLQVWEACKSYAAGMYKFPPGSLGNTAEPALLALRRKGITGDAANPFVPW
jgi:hypothetical protein